MKRTFFTAILLLLAVTAAAADWQHVAAGVDYQHIARGPLDVHVARIDLADPAVRVIATPKSQNGLTVSEFAKKNAAIVAVNGDYFDVKNKPVGMAMGACGVWAEADDKQRREPVVIVGAGRAEIAPTKEPLLSPEEWMTGAVAGWPMLVADCAAIEKLPGSDFFTRAPHPRTAVGLSRDGRTMFLVVADGRRKEVPGPTLPELASFMVEELGVCSALNLDGGGSTTMWVADKVVNVPSDGFERFVGNHLGVIAADTWKGCDERERKAKE